MAETILNCNYMLMPVKEQERLVYHYLREHAMRPP